MFLKKPVVPAGAWVGALGISTISAVSTGVWNAGDSALGIRYSFFQVCFIPHVLGKPPKNIYLLFLRQGQVLPTFAMWITAMYFICAISFRGQIKNASPFMILHCICACDLSLVWIKFLYMFYWVQIVWIISLLLLSYKYKLLSFFSLDTTMMALGL